MRMNWQRENPIYKLLRHGQFGQVVIKRGDRGLLMIRNRIVNPCANPLIFKIFCKALTVVHLNNKHVINSSTTFSFNRELYFWKVFKTLMIPTYGCAPFLIKVIEMLELFSSNSGLDFIKT